MKVSFTGTRLGMTSHQQAELIKQLHILGATELHHGDCTGADEQAHAIGRQLGLLIVGHPPVAEGLRAHCECDELRQAQEFLLRNRSMVLETEHLVAAPDGPERLRSGTWATVRFAKRISVPLTVLMPMEAR